MLAREEEISSCESEGVRIEYLIAPNRVLTEDGKTVGMSINKNGKSRRIGQLRYRSPGLSSLLIPT